MSRPCSTTRPYLAGNRPPQQREPRLFDRGDWPAHAPLWNVHAAPHPEGADHDTEQLRSQLRDRVRRQNCPRRRSVITVEITVATVFVLVAAIAATASPWLLVAGLAGYGAKDLWQHRTGYVANTRWWPPFCLTVDWLAAMIMAVAISPGASFN